MKDQSYTVQPPKKLSPATYMQVSAIGKKKKGKIPSALPNFKGKH